jgi:hypothetical protein
MNSPECCPSEFVSVLQCIVCLIFSVMIMILFNDDDDRIDDQHQYELPNSTHWTCKLFSVLIGCVWQWELRALLKPTIHTYTNATQNMGIS